MDQLVVPVPALQPFVEGFWRRRGTYDPPRTVRVFADACSKLIFELAPTPWLSCYFIGTQLTPIVVPLAGTVDRVGIRFRPGMATFLLGRTVAMGPQIDLAARAAPFAAVLADELRALPSDRERVDRVERWLSARLPLDSIDEADFADVVRIAHLLGEGRSAPEVAAALDWPMRRLQRFCRARFGTPAVTLHRLYRFERLRGRLEREAATLAEVAVDTGFADQAHMAREFRFFAGATVREFLRERASVANVQDGGGWLRVLREPAKEE